MRPSTILVGVVSSFAAVSAKDCQSGDEYDFIIVGGGTAGLTVAGRLSEGLPNECILVLEAGPDGRQERNIYIPGLKTSTFATRFDWNFTSIPQEAANDRLIAYWRGRTLGGSSAHNFMLWNGAAAEEYDAWERLGNPGWNWENMHEAMMRAENFHPSPEYDGQGLGTGGPIESSIGPSYRNQTVDFFTVMEESQGLPRNGKSLDGTPLGVMWQPNNIRPSNYTRSYSVEYIKAPPPNLHIWTDSQVARLNLDIDDDDDKHSKRITGVTLTNGTLLKCRKEVILSAGSLQSPQILELSGIGNSSILEAAGIPVLHHLPGVGENLQDHPRVPTVYRLNPPLFSADRLRYDAEYATEQMSLWNSSLPSEYGFTLGPTVLGSWAQISGELATKLTRLAQDKDTTAAGSTSSKSTPSPIDRERLRFLLQESDRVPEAEILLTDSYNGVNGYPLPSSQDYGSSFSSILSVLQHPFSVGSVHINISSSYSSSSSSSLSTTTTTTTTTLSAPPPPPPPPPPVINPNLLSHPYDLAAMTALAKYTRLLADSLPLSADFAGPYEPPEEELTDDEWENFVRGNVQSIYHPVGTCSMLPLRHGGVVDAELRVYGVGGLRVVDASVMPLLLSGHPQTAVYGVGERGAGMVVETWGGGGRGEK